MADEGLGHHRGSRGHGRHDKAVDSGWAKLKIEASAAEKQARIDSGKGHRRRQQVQAGARNPIDILEVDNTRCARPRSPACRRSAPPRWRRGAGGARRADRAAATSGDGNLLDLAIKAMRLRATVGEVSDALEKVFGRHRADTRR
jgi:methylmalonyl-CoA mutase